MALHELNGPIHQTPAQRFETVAHGDALPDGWNWGCHQLSAPFHAAIIGSMRRQGVEMGQVLKAAQAGMKRETDPVGGGPAAGRCRGRCGGQK